MTEVSVQLDDHNRDILFARRVEMLFNPNEDGTPSLDGKVIWHSEWWHYSGDIKRAASQPLRFERNVEDILTEEYEGIPAHVLIAAIKAAFIKHAREDLGLTHPVDDPEPGDSDP